MTSPPPTAQRRLSTPVKGVIVMSDPALSGKSPTTRTSFTRRRLMLFGVANPSPKYRVS